MLFALFDRAAWADDAPAAAAAVSAVADAARCGRSGCGARRAARCQQGRHGLADPATLLVVMMATPGLGLFYWRRGPLQNVSVLMQTLVIFCLLGVLWACVWLQPGLHR